MAKVYNLSIKVVQMFSYLIYTFQLFLTWKIESHTL